jgi:hypothetical protein
MFHSKNLYAVFGVFAFYSPSRLETMFHKVRSLIFGEEDAVCFLTLGALEQSGIHFKTEIRLVTFFVHYNYRHLKLLSCRLATQT